MDTYKNSEIKKIKAREILNSRGNPTLEVELMTDLGVFLTSVPSGASKGKYEAVELRDGGKRYQGKGVLKAVKNVNKIIAPKLEGKNVTSQKEIDELLLKLDGTKNKSHLGANTILAVSEAVCRAGAKAKNISLYQHIAQLSEVQPRKVLPSACFNIINGGVHAGNELDIQEFMIVPQMESFSKSLQAASEIYHTLRKILKEKYGSFATNIGDEGGFAPPLRFSEQALDLIMKAINLAGYEKKIKIILDVAASEFYENGKYKMKRLTFTKEGLLNFYSELLKKYPIEGIEDPFSEDDWDGWKMLMSDIEKQKSKILVIGDDLLVTNIERIKEAQRKKACNGLILKPNQIGTVSETIKAGKLAKDFGWKIMVSHRSGETNDDFISDLAVGVSADFIKSGAPAKAERMAKYNRLLRIEEEL